MPEISTDHAPVITLDGPGGSGKGTVSLILARRLGWHFLDSGALYRAVAVAARRKGLSLDDEAALGRLALVLPLQFDYNKNKELPSILLDGDDITQVLRSETCGMDASQVAALPAVREALLARQRAFRVPPGLVADGRDMGTVVFPDADLKIFLTASPQERAKRRYKQLKDKGMDVSLDSLLREIEARDARDSQREVAPLRPAEDAFTVDTTGMGIDQVVDTIMTLWAEVRQER
ncbi:MAG TPA: (d)CMP kinase [Gammaproteobacteria bacterium]|nr:(d)CMP kinase [Gammaproteobacteria bacterium]